MIISVILLSVSFITFFYFGLYVFFMDPKSPVYRNFLYMCLSFFLWSLSYLVLNISTGTNFYQAAYKISNLARLIYVPFTLRFFLFLTGYHKKIKFWLIFNIFIWIIPVIYMYNSIFNDYFGNTFFTGFWHLSSHIIFNLYNIADLILLIIWGKNSKFKRERKQAAIIVIGATAAILVTVLSDLAADLTKYPNLTPFFIMIWMFFIFYAMVKYQFFTYLPAYINQDVINNINESIIILDNKKNIFYINNKTKSLLNKDKMEICDPSTIIYEYFRINIEIDKILEGKFKTFSCRINYLRNNNEKVLVDAIFSSIKDKFNDILGILIIGYEIKGLKQLEQFYKTTDRESEIIQELAEGYTNKNIADHLGISENTLKRHIANIYAKLGISNKVELLNLLKDFNLIPNYKAEKTVLVLNKS
ncbi:MAG: hypothetical protein JXB50_09820 [Spirochaetes bacterium]|nr:hypothetical protein [Spirochaetota bacterium]